MSNNSITSIPSDAAQRAVQHAADMRAPVIRSISLDLDRGRLQISFSESVNVSSFNTSGLTLQGLNSVSSPSLYFQLTGGVALRNDSLLSQGDAVVNVDLSVDDLNAIKSLPDVASHSANTFLSVSPNTVFDMNGNGLAALPLTGGMAGRISQPDSQPPALVNYTVDLGADTILLIFSESVLTTSLNATAITVLSSSNSSLANVTYQLTGGSSASPFGRHILLQLSRADADNIKVLEGLMTNSSNTFISITSNLITDMANLSVNASDAGDALAAGDVIPDRKRPSLVCFDLNLNNNTLTLTFSESVRTSSLNMSQATVQNAKVGTTQVVLANSSTSSSNGPIIIVRLAFVDYNAIRFRTNLATDSSNTYLSLGTGFLVDMFGNQLNEIPTTNSTPVCNYYNDTSPPVLRSFDLRMTNGRLPMIVVLHFDEVVNVSTVDVTGVTLHSDDVASPANYTLTNGTVLNTQNSATVEIAVTNNDLNAVKALAPMLQNSSLSFVSVVTMLRNMVNLGNLPSTILPVSVHTADLSTPTLTSFSLDLDASRLVLNFSEPVIPSTVNVELLTLQSELSQLSTTTQAYTLFSSSRVANADLTTETSTIYISVSLTDSNNIKRRELLASNINSTFISVSRSLVEDPANNPSGAIQTSAGLPASFYTPDMTRPELLSFDIDVNTKIITLRFSESVNTTSLDPSQITVQNAKSQPSESYAFTQSLTLSAFGPTVELYVNRTDKNAIKQLENLLTNLNDSFISLTQLAISDMADNRIVPISENDALQATLHLVDETAPYLVGWDLNMNTGILSLEFDETVNVASFNTDQIVIQNAMINATIEYTLRATTTNDTSRAVVRFNLPPLDFNEIKRLGLCISTDVNCYLSFTSQLVDDMVGLSVVNISDSDGRRVRFRTPDTTSPELIEFVEFNLIDDTITLRFDETIEVTSLDISALTLQNFFEPPLLASHTLISGTPLSADNTTLVFSISEADQATIKSNSFLCTKRGDCYLTANSSFITDISGRPLSPVVHGAPGRIVTRFIADSQPPSLASYNVDLDQGIVTLLFDEAVSAGSLQPTALTFQIGSNDTSIFHTLTGGSTSSADGRLINLTLSVEDVRSLKSLDLATSANSTFISFSRQLVTDTAFRPNRVSAIASTDAENVTAYTEDHTRPILRSFMLDQDADSLLLTFSEPVRVALSQPTLLTILANNAASPAFITLEGGNVTSSNASNPGSHIITVHLTGADLTTLKLNSSLGTFTNNTFVTLATNMVTDMTGLGIADTASDPLPASNVQLDETRPRLISFMFDEDFGRINLTFSDVVRAETFDARGIILQDGITASASAKRFVLTQTSTTASPSGYVLMVQISEQDRYDLQLIDDLATNENNTYIALRARAVTDHRYLDVLAITDGDALKAAAYIEDTRRPELLEFDFDLNTGYLHLHFSDNIRLSTFNVTQITIQRDRSSVPSDVTLSGYQRVMRASNGTTLSIRLLERDLNLLKNDTMFASSNNTIYLSLTDTTVQDMGGNDLVQINSTAAKSVQTFTDDDTSPSLVSWNLDMNSLTLTLTWSEVINASSVRPSQFAIQGFSNRTRHMASFRQLTEQSTTSRTDDIVTMIYLGANDENAVKLLLDTATSDEDAYLVFSSNAFVDKNFRPAKEISPQSGHLVKRHGFTPDSTSPQLVGFSFNRNLGNLSLTFSEVLLLETFNLTEIRVQHNVSVIPTISRVLTGGVQSGPRGVLPIYDIALSQDDQNAIKRTDDLAINENNTYLSLSSRTVVDRNHNQVVAVPSTNATKVTRVIPDVTRPILDGFQIDLDAGILDMTFDEVVQAITLNTPQVILQNGLTFGGESVTLTSSSKVRNINDVNLVVDLSFTDLNNIKLARNLCTRSIDCHLNLTYDAVRDMSANSINASTQATQAFNLTRDTTRPSLVSFNISLDAEILYLEFSEAVDTRELNIRELSLQNVLDATAGTVEQLTFTNSSNTTSTSGYLININIGLFDLNLLKDFRNLASNDADTYLRFTENFVRDMNRNRVVPILNTAARNVTMHFVDQTSPALTEFDFDLNTGTLLLQFSETVDLASFDVSGITLHSASPAGLENFTLTSGSTAARPTEITVNITLSLEDLNRIKELDRLCISNTSTCFISMQPFTVNDTASNQLSQVSPSSPRPVYNYTADTIRPQLQSFLLDLNLQEITFRFSETVRASTLRITDVTLYERENDTSIAGNHHMFAAGLTLSRDSSAITVRLGRQDFDDITRKQLCRSSTTCYLSHSTAFVEDMNFNNVTETPVTDLMQLSTFIVDAQRPVMVNFTHFDLDEGILQLEFNETVRASTVNISALALQSYINPAQVRDAVQQSYTSIACMLSA